jgi:hypothetical protein
VLWLTGLANSSIFLPVTDEELEHISTLNRVVGLPGCTGSANCLCVFSDIYRAHLPSRCKGKEVSLFSIRSGGIHTKNMLSGVQYMIDNNKISRSDSAILPIGKEGDIFKQPTFKYYKEEGSVAKEK